MAKKNVGIANLPGRKVNLATLGVPGTTPDHEERAARRLARAMHWSESTDVAISWSAQERAQDFYNANGLAATLNEARRLEALALPENADEVYDYGNA
jgi:hypothetical protein